MSNNRKINLIFIFVLLVVLLSSLFVLGEASPKYTLKLAHISNVEHPAHKGSLLFKQLVEERTNGDVQIEIYPNSTLGSAPEYTEQMKLGAVDLGLSTSGQLQLWVKEYAAVMIPFLFTSYEHAHRALDGPAGDLLAEKAEKEIGLITLANWEWGFEQTTNNKLPINSVKDVEGIKMRVPNEIQLLEMWKALGANITLINFPELYLALAQGVVDGQSNPLTTIYYQKFYEVQKYLAITNHVYNTQILMASKIIWDTLPEDIQRILKECAQVAGLYVRQISNLDDELLVKACEEKGMVVTYPNLAEFRSKMGPAIDAIAKFTGEDFTKQFVELVKAAQ